MCEVRTSGPEHVREAQDRDRGVRVALGELVQRRPPPRRCRARSPVRGGCGRRIVSSKKAGSSCSAAVEVGRGLEDHLAHRRVRPAAGGEDVHRPDHVVLVGLRGRGRRRSPPPGACPPPCRSRPPRPRAAAARAGRPPSRTRCARARPCGSSLSTPITASTSGKRLERLGEPAAPVGREPGDEDAPRVHAATRTRPTCAWRACPRGSPGCARGPRGRPSGRAPCPRACPPRRSGSARGSAA